MVINGPHMNQYPTFTVHRKAAKRTLPWDLTEDEIQLASPRPQDEDACIRETKRPRLEEGPVPTSTGDATNANGSHDTMVALPPDAAAAEPANSDPVVELHPNTSATRASRRWTQEEDAKLTSAVANTRKKKRGKEYKSDWVEISAQIPGRTRTQCHDRWHKSLEPSINRPNIYPNMRTTRASRYWTPEEDAKLTSAVANTRKQKEGKEYKSDWVAISTQVPGRTRNQCYDRWQRSLDPSINRTNMYTGTWKEDEDKKLKAAVKMHDGKDWLAIAALVSGRTRTQCHYRWHFVLDPSIDRANEGLGTWKEDEDIKLKAAVQMHGGKNWAAIVAVVPGRTRNMCHYRWHYVLDPSIDRANATTGKWDEDEDIKLKNAVRTHGKNWVLIAALIPGRTKVQCGRRWRVSLDPNRSTVREEADASTLNKAPAL
jgi:hypothetical protein